MGILTIHISTADPLRTHKLIETRSSGSPKCQEYFQREISDGQELKKVEAYAVLHVAAHEHKGRHEALMYPVNWATRSVSRREYCSGLACSVPPRQMVTDVSVSCTSGDMPVKAGFRYPFADAQSQGLQKEVGVRWVFSSGLWSQTWVYPVPLGMAVKAGFRYPIHGLLRSGQWISRLGRGYDFRHFYLCVWVQKLEDDTPFHSNGGVTLQKVAILQTRRGQRRRRTYANGGEDERPCLITELAKEVSYL
ncbi:hypothetical protein J6590_098446 [Homalodisca vitripennis]|nr:hypothetical protein J6590_098446 [Homalodisca vitripennis]